MNTRAYDKLNYSLGILSAAANGKRHGCVVNSFHQVTSSFPAKFTVTVNRDNETCGALEAAGSFSFTALASDAPSDLVTLFGHKSGRVVDKFAQAETVHTDENGNPYITTGMVSRISCKIVDKLEIGRYVLFVGQATGAEVLSDGEILTLKEYSNRGKPTPAQATVYRTVEINGYQCDICGYVYEGEAPPPADYHCPLCNAGAEHFFLIQK